MFTYEKPVVTLTPLLPPHLLIKNASITEAFLIRFSHEKHGFSAF
jgi:hypothetical protein